jgi:hypothetical protein
MIDIGTVVIWAVLIGFSTIILVLLGRILIDRNKSRVLHQLSDGTFALIAGEVEKNKLKAKNKTWDLKDIRVYNLRTMFGFKPFYITTHGRNKPLQIKGDFLESEELTPEQVRGLGELSVFDSLIKAKIRGAQSSRMIIAASIMSFMVGLLLALAFK